MAPKTKDCPAGKILNPATGRCVNIDGKIGKAIVAKLAKPAKLPTPPKSTKSASPTASQQKNALLKHLIEVCNNESDPISMDNFEDLTLDQLKTIVLIGKGAKKNCYLLENIYEVYKTAVLSKKEPKDPMDPGHVLSKKEIDDINDKMKASDANYKPPKFKTPRPYPKGYELAIEMSPAYPNYFSIKVKKNNTVKFDLGIVPGWVETNHTGSADYTSGVLLSNLRETWEKAKFMNSVNSCCNVQLRRSYAYWQGHTWKARFIQLCEDVKSLLD